MTKAVQLSELAQRQVIEISLWYRTRKRRLGAEFIDELNRILDRVAEFGELYPIVYRDYRQALLDRFPYRVYYRVLDRGILVLGLLHVRRDRDPFLKDL